MQSIENKTSARIYGNQRGWAFSKTDFLDLGNDADIRKALSGLAARGTIRRVLRGVYDYPRISKLLDSEMGPDLDQVAQALARKSGWRIQPSENTALNQFSTLKCAISHKCNFTILPHLKKRRLKESGFKLRQSELVVQALKALGQERIDAGVCQKLSEKWTPDLWQKILRDSKTAPAWVCDVIRKIAKEKAS